MAHSTIRGSIRYTSRKPERLNQERGREHFTLTAQADGVRVLHAHCEIDDAPNVIRDVVLAIDARGRPLDCSVRLTVGDRFEGTGTIFFGPHHAHEALMLAQCRDHDFGRQFEVFGIELREKDGRPLGEERVDVSLLVASLQGFAEGLVNAFL